MKQFVRARSPRGARSSRVTRDRRARGKIVQDAGDRRLARGRQRAQTEYGTLRSYFRTGWENTTPAATGGGTTAIPFWDRAFIQFAGFTVGRAQSFYDLFTFGGAYTYLNVRTAGDTGASGQNLWAYTAQFGNGVSYSVSLEDPVTRKGAVMDTTCAQLHRRPGPACPMPLTPSAAAPRTAAAAIGQFGFRVPDIITNLRIDQSWGYVGVSTAIHEASGAYYGTPNTVNAGHPADKYGWAFAVGGLLNLQGGDIIGVNFSMGQRRGRLHHQLVLVAVLPELQQPGDGLGFGRRVQHRHRRRADRVVERERRLPAHLGTGGLVRRQVADLGVRRLRGHQLQ